MAEPWAASFYTSTRWKKFRLALIRERGLRCEKCGRTLLDESLIEADHIRELTPDNILNPAISLNPHNIQLLCKDCHNEKHGRYGHEAPKRVTLVYGAPCAGKATYVQKHLQRGDIVMDFDRLFQAISGRPLHDKPQNLNAVVFKARDDILDSIKTRYGKWHHAFVVGTYPHKAQREDLAKQLDAELVLIDTSKEECLLRAECMGVFATEYKKYVERWFEDFER